MTKEGDISAFIILSSVIFIVSYLLNQIPVGEKKKHRQGNPVSEGLAPWKDNLEMWTTAKLGNPAQEKRMLANHFIAGTR